TTDTVLRRGDAGALRDAAEALREVRRGRHIGRWLGAGLAVRNPCLAVREPGTLHHHLRARPRRAAFGEPGAPRQPAEVREAVVAERRGQVELLEQVHRRLTEVGLAMDDRLVINRQVALHGVGTLVRGGGDELSLDREQVASILTAQVLT